ncbi:MAG: hypothetical protein JXO44_03015 [Clostridia bacterium]|nr:hypothetical protein [Clostridia bacterium]
MCKKWMILIIGMALTVGGCTVKEPQAVQAPQESSPVQATDSTVETPISPVEDTSTSALKAGLENLLVAETTAPDIVQYIEANISEATNDDAEFFLKCLMVYQTEYVTRGHEVIYSNDYMDALNTTMGGVLDASKIADIEDAEIRAFYQGLYDSYLTIVRYEEMPVIEMDWKRVAILDSAASETLKYYIEEMDTRHYPRNDAYYSAAQKIVELETIIPETKSEFVTSLLEEMYRLKVSRLVSGPEGSYSDAFMTRSDNYYSEMMRFANDYPESPFAGFIKSLEHIEEGDIMAVFDALQAYRMDNPFRRHHWRIEAYSDGDKNINRSIYVDGAAGSLAEKINGQIEMAMDEMFTMVKAYASYSISSFGMDDYGDFVTIGVSLNYENPEGQYVYAERYLNIDLKTGETISLEDYLGMSSNEVITWVNEMCATNYTLVPEFQISNNGLLLSAQEADTATSNYGFITNKALLLHVGMDKLTL